MRHLARTSLRPDPRFALWLVMGYAGLVAAVCLYTAF